MSAEQAITDEKFKLLLPDLNQARYYGEATKLIRSKVDKYFGIERAGSTEYKVTIDFRGSKDYIVEAFSEDEAADKAMELASEDSCDNLNIEVGDIEEIES